MTHQPDQQIDNPEIALEFLKKGNERYLSGSLCNKDSYAADREILKNGQKPFAVILTCADSRVSPEIYFDQRLGDIFIVRNAGNVADPIALGSIEYAVEHLHAPLIVIVGHSSCGAVTAAVKGGNLPPNIKAITDLIEPAHRRGGDDVELVAHFHVEEMVDAVRNDAIVKHFGTKVLGAYYNIHTGVVEWL